MTKTIHFSHANGFPARSYSKLFSLLEPEYRVGFIEKIGHTKEYPVTKNWEFLVEELLDHLKTNYTEPIVGIGHSLGAVLTFLAAIKEPDRFKGIVIIDAPIMGFITSHAIQMARQFHLLDYVTPAGKTKNRTSHWSTKEERNTYFNTHPFFKHFDPDCLNDYMEHGTNIGTDGFSLSFDPQIEYNIYRTIPDHLYKYKGKLNIPAATLYGTKSNVMPWHDRRNMKHNHHMTMQAIEGEHLFPFYKPEETVSQLKKLIKDW